MRPEDPLERLRAVKARMDRIKASPEAHVQLQLNQIGGCLLPQVGRRRRLRAGVRARRGGVYVWVCGCAVGVWVCGGCRCVGVWVCVGERGGAEGCNGAIA